MKIAFVTSRFPYPLEKGDKLRAYQQIRLLHGLGHEVHLFAVSDVSVAEEHIDRLKGYCKSITIHRISRLNILLNLMESFFRGRSAQSCYFFNRAFKQEIQQRIKDLGLGIAYFQLIRTALYAEGIHHIPKVLDFQDAFSTGMIQRAKTASGFWKFIFNREASLLNQYEIACSRAFDSLSIISESDRGSLGIDPLRHIHIVPNGIDCDYFDRKTSTNEVDILFVGNMGYKPNIDASLFLIHQVMPLVWQRMPHVKVMLAGANPSQEVRGLAGSHVEVTGWVDDIRSCYSKTRLFVAPMVSGTGLQNKILEAMAMGIPTVTTPICARSLADGHEQTLFVRDQPSEIASALLELLSNPHQLSQIGLDSRSYILRNYDLNSLSGKIESLFQDAVEHFGKRKP